MVHQLVGEIKRQKMNSLLYNQAYYYYRHEEELSGTIKTISRFEAYCTIIEEKWTIVDDKTKIE